MPIEPVVFAALLMALTLGINMYVPSLRTADDTAHKAQPTEPSSPAQVAQAS